MLRALFGLGPSVNIKQLLEGGAAVIDVRSPGEFSRGHAKGSINIPVDGLLKNLNRIDRSRQVITCCASGMRSASAADILRNHGYEAHNGGPWTKVQAAMNVK